MTDIVPAFCVVTEGELRSLAYQFRWGAEKASAMAFLLDYFRRVSIETPETMEAYAVIDAYSKSVGVTMGKNDVWIAASARVTGFELLTTDADFDHLSPRFIKRTRIEVER